MDALAEIRHPTAEQTVIGGMLQSEDTALELFNDAKIQPHHFESEIYQLIAEACQRVLRSAEPYDLRSVADTCKRIGREDGKTKHVPQTMLEELALQDGRRARAYALTIKRYATYRSANEFAEWVKEELIACPDPDELHGELLARANQIIGNDESFTRFVEGERTIPDHRSLIRQRVAAYKAGEQRLFPWPWESWNERIALLRPGLVGQIIAPTKMGKSVYLECIWEFWASLGYQVVAVHCENDLEYTRDRRMARWAEVPIEKIESGNLTDDDLGAIEDAEKRMAPWSNNLHYLNGAGASMDDICAELSARANEGRCDVVVLDYFNKVQYSRGLMQAFRGNPILMQGQNADILKTFAIHAKVPVFTASQMNKTGMEDSNAGQRMTGDKIRGSGEVLEKFQLNVTMTRDIVTEDKTDYTGRVVLQAGQRSPVAKLRVDSQNRGGESEFKQLFVGQYFDVREKPQ